MTHTETGPGSCLRRPYRPTYKPPSRSAAMAGKGVFASRDQSVRKSGLETQILAHRAFPGRQSSLFLNDA